MVSTNNPRVLEEPLEAEGLPVEDEEAGPWLPRERPLSVEQLVKRAHCGLGHVANDRLATILILHQAGARKEAVEYAKKLKCDVCQRHKHTAPATSSSTTQRIGPNQIVGIDTIYLPGLQFNGKRKMALNILYAGRHGFNPPGPYTKGGKACLHAVDQDLRNPRTNL